MNNGSPPQVLMNRYITIFQRIDLSKHFYYSNTYNLTQSLQKNTSQPKELQNMFVWNRHLFEKAHELLQAPWGIPLIHGFVDQSSKTYAGFIF
jgi:hypothetical protein